VVSLTLCADVAAADWLVRSTLPWHQLVCFGPGGFDAYARLRLLPDPVRPGQSENDAEAEDWRAGQPPRLFELLASRTATPDDCYFCVWEGFGQLGSVTDAPNVQVPHRAYWLLRGPLADIGTWDGAGPGQTQLAATQPAFVWPADHAWCVAWDVDPHWVGIGGDTPLISRLVGDPLLDVVPADPSAEQPSYR
jgi:hypothetical protein